MQGPVTTAEGPVAPCLGLERALEAPVAAAALARSGESVALEPIVSAGGGGLDAVILSRDTAGSLIEVMRRDMVQETQHHR